MNPTEVIEVPGTDYTSVDVEYTRWYDYGVDVEYTRWYDYGSKEPGQPGVFEVDPLQVDDGREEMRRFSFFNGKDFGPVMRTPDDAYGARFGRRVARVAKFRGLVEQA